ncbi:MAG TPA: hypothetical protein VMU09_11105 [Acidimicrobiales bacterium]|nr:hypothetical protein [Acidimicrobiales bacterium]
MTLPNPDHPAPFSAVILEVLQTIVDRERRRLGRDPHVCDPFAGIGRVHQLRRCVTVGVEIEPEWVACHHQTVQGDATALPPEWADRFDVVATSPVYPNRMTDHHDARDPHKTCDGQGCPSCKQTGRSPRKGYKFSLGRDPSPGSAAVMSWGPEYRNLHRAAAAEMLRVLTPGGLAAIDMSDSFRTRAGRGQERIPAVEWWRQTLEDVGFRAVAVSDPIATPRMRRGANYEARVEGEQVITGRKR